MESLNSRIPLPSDFPISGRRFAPKRSSASNSSPAISRGPTFGINNKGSSPLAFAPRGTDFGCFPADALVGHSPPATGADLDEPRGEHEAGKGRKEPVGGKSRNRVTSQIGHQLHDGEAYDAPREKRPRGEGESDLELQELENGLDGHGAAKTGQDGQGLDARGRVGVDNEGGDPGAERAAGDDR